MEHLFNPSADEGPETFRKPKGIDIGGKIQQFFLGYPDGVGQIPPVSSVFRLYQDHVINGCGYNRRLFHCLLPSYESLNKDMNPGDGIETPGASQR